MNTSLVWEEHVERTPLEILSHVDKCRLDGESHVVFIALPT